MSSLCLECRVLTSSGVGPSPLFLLAPTSSIILQRHCCHSRCPPLFFICLFASWRRSFQRIRLYSGLIFVLIHLHSSCLLESQFKRLSIVRKVDCVALESFTVLFYFNSFQVDPRPSFSILRLRKPLYFKIHYYTCSFYNINHDIQTTNLGSCIKISSFQPSLDFTQSTIDSEP
jgi:hypothetical protein